MHDKKPLQLELQLQLQLQLQLPLPLHFGIDCTRLTTQKRNLKFSWLPFGPWSSSPTDDPPACLSFGTDMPVGKLALALALALPTRAGVRVPLRLHTVRMSYATTAWQPA